MENIIMIPIMICVFAFGFFVADLIGRPLDEGRRNEYGHSSEKRKGNGTNRPK